eukprot:9292542-Prorocentrum_lima.AAC.1
MAIGTRLRPSGKYPAQHTGASTGSFFALFHLCSCGSVDTNVVGATSLVDHLVLVDCLFPVL